MNKEIHPKFKLRWQEGYGVLSLRKDELVKVSRYIDRQEEPHRCGTLSDLLERFECEEDDWPEGVEESLLKEADARNGILPSQA
jgi:hypothetical protein